MRERAVFRDRADAGNCCQHLFGDAADDILDLAAAVRRKQTRKTLVLEVAAEQRANARSGDAEGIAGVASVRQHEDAPEQLAHGAWVDIAALGGARIAALVVPIRKEFPVRRMFHTLNSPRARSGGTDLSRFRARTFPLLLCRRGLAASMPKRHLRLVGAAFAALTLS